MESRQNNKYTGSMDFTAADWRPTAEEYLKAKADRKKNPTNITKPKKKRK